LTVDTTLACLASLEELKDIHGPINDAVAEVSRLEPFSFAWKEGTNQRAGDTQEQLGLGAHQVAAIDKRLVSYSDDGKLLGVRYQEMTALLVQAIKEQQAEIEELKRAR
jgi:oligoribonuclease NrnB/cAMP/cGMP phosphodiesterase (DHH superfamily)